MNGFIILGIVIVVLVVIFIILRIRKRNLSRFEYPYVNSYNSNSGGSFLSKAKNSIKNLACCLKSGGGA